MKPPHDASPRYYTEVESPLGALLLLGDGHALTGLYMPGQKHHPMPRANWCRNDEAFRAVREQLQAYFGGALQRFNLPLAPEGSAFQQQVWTALREIPYGRTQTYGALADRIGAAQAARAVGLANGRNPISIIVPCHRVIGATGALAGYAGGVERKRWLLAHEQRHASRVQSEP